MTDQDKIKLLRDLLLSEDREVFADLSSHVEKIDHQINTRQEFEPIVEPIIDEKLNEFQESIPEKLGPSITKALKKQISESQDEVIDILYPIIGKLINKYIKREFEILSEKMDAEFEKAFSIDGWKRRIKGWFSGTKESSNIINELNPPELLEMFIIEKESGLLIAHYSKTETLDADLVAGMLTAIKSFVEDSFDSGNQELEMIEYDAYKIHLRSLKSFYISSVISGTTNAMFKAKLENYILEFAEQFLSSKKLEERKSESDIDLTKQLESFINGAEI